MSRPMLLVFLLLVLIVTSQFEWRQQLMSDVDTSSKDSHKQEQISKREEIIKEKENTGHKGRLMEGKAIAAQGPPGTKLTLEKIIFESGRFSFFPPFGLLEIILSQEKNIQRLNELVRSLREQLHQCRNINETLKSTHSSLTERIIELERQQILED